MTHFKPKSIKVDIISDLGRIRIYQILRAEEAYLMFQKKKVLSIVSQGYLKY